MTSDEQAAAGAAHYLGIESRVEGSTRAPSPTRWNASATIDTLRETIGRLTEPRNVEHSSVVLKRGAQGQTLIEVQVRTVNEGDVTTPEQAKHEAQRIYDELCRAYPSPDGRVRGGDA
jgi:hypothetical protein